jgi:hypothetical protein
VNDNDDIEVQLTISSGFAQETTSSGLDVQSDVVVWDMYLEQIIVESDPIVVVQPATTNLSITEGQDVRLTLQVYIRPSRIFDVGDDGAYDEYLASDREVSATFWLWPEELAYPVQLSSDITLTLASDDDTDAWIALDADDDDNHIPADIADRELLVWEVILENPMEQLVSTDEAKGNLYAVITSKVDGKVVNQFSTWGDDDSLVQGDGSNAVDLMLDTDVALPLDLILQVFPD